MGADLLIMTFIPEGDPSWDVTKELIETVGDCPGAFGEEHITKNIMLEYLQALKEAWLEGNRRDSMKMCIGDKTVLISGGMSWGDSPTEMYDILQHLELSGMLDVLGNHTSAEEMLDIIEEELRSMEEFNNECSNCT